MILIVQGQSQIQCAHINLLVIMEIEARKDSLLSEQQSQKVQLYFSILNLNASLAYLQIYLEETNKPKKLLSKTKPQAPHNQVYEFSDSLVVEYFFQIRQKIIVEIYSAKSSYRQLLGVSSATIGEIYNARSTGIQKNIEFQGGKRGSMNFRGQKVQRGTNKFIEFTLNARNIDVGSAFLCFGSGGCHWKLYKRRNNQQFLLYQSEVRQGKDNRFNPMKINQKRLCNNDPKQPIIFKFYQNSGHVLIGEVKTQLQGLTNANPRFTLTKNNSQKGVIILEKFKQTVKYDFTDYLSNGMQMSMIACIDFTASNGIQTTPSSLHYITPSIRSKYEEALFQVCNIVLDYDNDKLVPTFGFGAKVNMPNFTTGGKVHHCFPLNGSTQNPNLYQLAGIMEGYRKALPYLSFGGPTFFAPLLREAMNVSQMMKNETKDYMILMILTDGIIHDKEEVKNLLVKCCRLPMSVIIIGIGNGEDWSAMHELDDDDCKMTDENGNRSERDLVQFVEFASHNNNGVELAKEVLEELPRQVQEYHQLVGLTPMDYAKNLNGDILFQKQQKLL